MLKLSPQLVLFVPCSGWLTVIETRNKAVLAKVLKNYIKCIPGIITSLQVFVESLPVQEAVSSEGKREPQQQEKQFHVWGPTLCFMLIDLIGFSC